MDAIHTGFNKAGLHFIERAKLEGIMSHGIWSYYQETHHLQPEDISPVLQAVFNKLDGHIKKDDEAVVVTQPDTKIFACRDELSDRFKVKILSTEEVVNEMKKKKKGIKT